MSTENASTGEKLAEESKELAQVEEEEPIPQEVVEVQPRQEVTQIAIVEDGGDREILSAEEMSEGNNQRADNNRQTAQDDDRTYQSAMVEQAPSFPGGQSAMYQWLASNINYPADAAEEGAQGRVVVEFVVGKDGAISNARVVRSKHPSLDREALRVIRAMPRWIPGRNNGQNVNVTYTLPVTFRLQ